MRAGHQIRRASIRVDAILADPQPTAHSYSRVLANPSTAPFPTFPVLKVRSTVPVSVHATPPPPHFPPSPC